MPSDPALAAVLDAAVPFALPLRRPFRGITVREGVLIRGATGWGEFAPFDDYSDVAASRWLDSAVEAAFGRFARPLRHQIAINAIIPAVDAADATALAREAVVERGCLTIKVKVGSPSLADDEERVAAVRDVLDTLLGPGAGAIRIDANAAWDVPRATSALRRLGTYGIEYVEQPCPSVDELRALHRLVDIPLAIDETIRTSDDPGSLRVGDYADVAVLKPAPLGGVARLLAVAAAIDVPVVVSGSLDSSVGLDVAIAAAAALPDLPFACGLGTGALLAADVTASVRQASAGVLSVGRISPDHQALMDASARLAPERTAWWRRRLERAWRSGAGRRSGSLVLDAT